ncbi:hypothetical protein ACO0LL_02755 [Undibacterium sp. TC4M20W]|uniref:hypothetical protein n=1 Tax=Undibacterium sp. TC4M20W TaxID=3413052 RepID=UPI003BF34FFC
MIVSQFKPGFLALLLVFTHLCAQAGSDDVAKANTSRLKQLKVAELALQEAATKTYRDDKAKRLVLNSKYMSLGLHRSLAGDLDGAVAAFNQMPVDDIPATKEEFDSISNAKAEDAIAAIVREARKTQVVILNEAHHVPMHRAFAMKLARELKKAGYTYLACEAFYMYDDFPLQKQYVSEKAGILTKEATYANFLRDAMHDQWKFVSYESVNGPRESGMAKNLVQKIFRQDPKAKVFIYVGYSHAYEFPVAETDDDKSKMAAQLKRLTGINPLTIDQTAMYEHVDSKRQSNLYKAALARMAQEKPFVLKSGEQQYLKLGINNKLVDMQIIYPAYSTSPVTGRASWLTTLAGFTPRDIPKELLPTTGQRLIYAFHKQEPADGMPADVVMVQAGKTPPKLMLPPGEFRFAFED